MMASNTNAIRIAVRSALVAVPLSFVHVGASGAQSLESFAIIAGQSLTNTGATTITGNIAVWPGSSYTGSGTVTQTGETYLGDAVAQRIQDDLTTLYTYLAGRPTTQDLTGQDLGGMVLTPGVYNFDSSANLAGTLTLDAQGDPNAIFIFNIGSTLTAGPGSNMVLVNGAQGGNVFFRVGSSATLDTSADMEGQVVALTSISMNHSASLSCGAAYARNGSVTLISNTINICTLAGTGFDDVVDDLDDTATEQELAIAQALADYVAGGGALPIGLAILAATMTPAELAAVLAQLSGEVSTGVAPMGMQSMDAFLDTVLNSGRNPRVQRVVPPRDHGAPIGMVQDDNIITGKYGSAAPPSRAQTLAFSSDLIQPDSGDWDIWLSGYGSRNLTYGNASLGHHERTSVTRGIATGVNYAPSDRTSFGFAASWNTADFTLSDGFGSGASKSVFIALRGRTSTEHAYIEGALAFGRSNITTDRTVTIAGTDRFTAETTAHSVAAHIEAGYHMGMFTPFAGLRAQSFRTPAYSETTVAGSSSFALQHDAHTTTSIRSQLGVDMQWTASTSESRNVAFGVRAAWSRELASNDPGTSSFVNVPGVSFPVTGATRDRDSLMLAASATLMDRNGLFIVAAVSTEYARNARDYGGSLTLGYSW